ncbi:hypothetical protein CGMCC3_g14310 [Colletotrichum fructicola]|uniref:Uncharacterized protein n=2 Tax=Colletotrichum fructicola (strain Nara gc5) TaxID=1213859 RepID=A0A7J6J9F5_COLFN|nr:uncharacterized protein CGMCC3_g14310 [Colletotrichum fructicola]KAF4486501.1 hypothetical protein CGGC5_v005645 [Colletotrichum fructicola Nara gc5]KAE9569534.1 hypothetical protein CGMCC3_g14310 [Colletotrichum fructicola]KAF4424065.1 hypothetical protein CFRS1_v006855 [Colletotrichum fructicola]KAF4932726.1 hypothetical protein CGCF245_v010364 [Colletotrichum fructicola]KAF5495531.1 hypothetical protein CGCF413_v008423 [Colletotrichum fructicola]
MVPRPPRPRRTSPSIPPPSPFPTAGVATYHSLTGPSISLTPFLLRLHRFLSDYESAQPLLSPTDLSRDWDATFNPAALPRPPHQSLRVAQADIDAEWDPWKLRAMIAATCQDIERLQAHLIEVERRVHDVNRDIEDAKRRERGRWGGVDAGAGFLDLYAPRVDGYRRRRRKLLEVDKYEVCSDWDLFKLRDVFSEAQTDIDKLLDTLEDLETEIREKRRLLGSLRKYR